MARLIMTLHYHQGELDVRKLAITSNQRAVILKFWIKGQTNYITLAPYINQNEKVSLKRVQRKIVIDIVKSTIK